MQDALAGSVSRSVRDLDTSRFKLRKNMIRKLVDIYAERVQPGCLQIGIDGSMDPRGSDPRDQGLSDRRVGAVRDALIQAGVPSSKIQTGAFGDTRLTRDRRVEVLVKTGS